MKSEIVFHGVPQGHNTWGTDDAKYYEGFYNGIDAFSKTKNLFVVEVLRNGGSFSAFYSLIKAYQVTALNGRSGSYFGMTLRVDGEYCTQVHSLCNLFEQVFSQKIVGQVLESVGDGYKYKVAQFSDCDKLLSDVKQVLEKKISAFFSNDFEEFDESFTKDQASVHKFFNIDDTDSEAFLNSTRKYGKILISPEYPSKDSQINSFDSKLASIKKELETERDSKARAEEAAVALKKKVMTLESQLEAAKNTSDVRAVANRLEKPMAELLALLRNAQGTTADLDMARENGELRKKLNRLQGKLSKIKTFLYAAVGVAFLLLALTIYFAVSSAPRKQGNATDAKYVELQGKYEKLMADYSDLKNSSQVSKVDVAAVLKPYWNNSRIDVTPDPLKENDVYFLTKGQKYNISLKGELRDKFNNKGEWILSGVSFAGGIARGDCTVIPNVEGSAKISYSIDGVEIASRLFNVK